MPDRLLGIYNATPPTVPDGNIAEGQIDSRANLKVTLANGVNTIEQNAIANGRGQPNVALSVGAYPMLSNGTTFDPQRSNQDNISLVPSAVYTSTQTSADQTNYNATGVIVVLDATAVTAVGSFTLAIQGKDPVSGKYYALLTGAAVSTVTTNVYMLYPGVTVAANLAVSAPLPRTWRVVATYNSGTNLTFSVGASLIL